MRDALVGERVSQRGCAGRLAPVWIHGAGAHGVA